MTEVRSEVVKMCIFGTNCIRGYFSFLKVIQYI